MKNVIVLLCDSLSYDEDFFNDMPCLKSIRDNCLVFNNYFSQAPYTEAALNSLLSSTNTLDYKGYFNNLKHKPITINEVFKELGFKTFNTMWFYPNTKSFLRGLDEYVYVDLYSITYYITCYRIEYFMSLKQSNKINNEHMNQLKILLSDFYDMCNIYIDDYFKNRYRFEILDKYSTFKYINFQELANKIKLEEESFKANKDKYINLLLCRKNDFFKNEKYEIIKSEEFKKYSGQIDLKVKYESIKQLSQSLIRCRDNKSFYTFKHTLKKLKSDETYNSFYKWLKYTINYPLRYAYEQISAKTLLEYVGEYLIKNTNNKNFVLCHMMDNHYPFNFLSNEQENIKEEFDEFKKNLKNSTKGINRFYAASKTYIDKNIKIFIDNLEKENLLQDSLVVITADHGSSYMNKIHRTEICSTFYDENYRIPLIVYNPNIKGKVIGNYGTAKDFIPTILEVLNINFKEKIEGKSILHKNRDFIIFEYNGSGCPDYVLRDKLFCIRSKKYKIIYKLAVENEVEDGEIISIYDIENDPLELKNKKDILLKDFDVINLLNNLFKRIEEIR